MSTVKTDLLQNRLGTSHPAVTKADWLKAWLQFNGGPAAPAIGASLNIASLTDNGVGSWSPVFTSLFFTATGYTVQACGITMTNWSSAEFDGCSSTASTCLVRHVEQATGTDSNNISATLTGRLA